MEPLPPNSRPGYLGDRDQLNLPRSDSKSEKSLLDLILASCCPPEILFDGQVGGNILKLYYFLIKDFSVIRNKEIFIRFI